jgi:hypothetical protein
MAFTHFSIVKSTLPLRGDSRSNVPDRERLHTPHRSRRRAAPGRRSKRCNQTCGPLAVFEGADGKRILLKREVASKARITAIAIPDSGGHDGERALECNLYFHAHLNEEGE